MPRIPPETIDKIRNEVDIVEVISSYIPLTSHGKNFFGVCPFHQDHSPSMSVSREKQMFKCFSCGAAGNVFKFIQDIEGITYLDAVNKMAEKIGLSISITQSNKTIKKYENEYNIMNLALIYYENNLNTIEGSTARDYLKTRGLEEEMIKVFNIGLSFSNDTLYEFFQKKKIPEKDLVALGLVNQDGLKYHDVFQNRILFPIHNPTGEVVGFTGRIYEDGRTPKYLNSRETVIFRKGNILFNYHRARDSIRTMKQVIVVEGNMDAIRMYVSGFKNTVALMGTSLTKEQITLLLKLRVPVLLMLDNDDAGNTATMNNGTSLEDAGLEVQVVRLSGEKDPDEYIIKNGIDAMADNIRHPISFLEFKLQYLKQNRNLEDPNDLASYIRSILKTLEGSDSLTVDITLQKLSNTYKLSYETLKRELESFEVIPKTVKETPKKNVQNRYESSAKHVLYYMMNSSKYIKMYQKKLGYFKEEIYRGVANEILYYYDKKKEMVIADFLSYAEDSPLKEQIYDVIKNVADEELNEDCMEEYIYNINEVLWKDQIKNLKKEIKNTSDIHKKELLGNNIIDITKKIQEMKLERSVKND